MGPWNTTSEQESREKPQATSGLIFIRNLTPMWSFFCLFIAEVKFIQIYNLETLL